MWCDKCDHLNETACYITHKSKQTGRKDNHFKEEENSDYVFEEHEEEDFDYFN